jgi:hypothetical protein
MAIFSEHRFYMNESTKQQYFPNKIADTIIPNLGAIEECVYGRYFEKQSIPDDTFLQNIPITFVDFIPTSLSGASLRTIQDFHYLMKFGFSIDKLDNLFVLKPFTDRLNFFQIPWFYIVGNQNFTEKFLTFLSETTRVTGRDVFAKPVTNEVVLINQSGDSATYQMGLLSSYFEKLNVIADTNIIDLNSVFSLYNIDGSLDITTKTLTLINNYPISVIC